MKEAIKNKINAFISWLEPAINFVMPALTFLGNLALSAIGAAIGLIAIVIVVVGLMLISVAGPALIPSALLWGAWTYMGMGAEYFPMLSDTALNAPFLHFLLPISVVIWLHRMTFGNGAAKMNKIKDRLNSLTRRFGK